MKKSIFAFASVAMLLSSCVNEWPHPEYRLYDITLKVHSVTDWLPDYDMTNTRAEGLEIQYQIQIYKSGTTLDPVWSKTVYSLDMNRPDFTVDLSLYPGDYDVYVWSDICDASTGESLYYDFSDFAKITYLTPYRGDSDNKDAFRGMTSFTIEDTMYLNPTATEEITLRRPLARYMFVATDLGEFVDNELTRGKLRGVGSREGDIMQYAGELADELDSYTIKIIYPLYMPAVFDNFTNKPIDSWTGVSFEGHITPISSEEAILGLDFVMMNGDESYVQVAMEIYDDEGNKIGGTSTINIPTLRDRTTVVYGRFLTSDEDAGVAIDPNFSGQFNIPYR